MYQEVFKLHAELLRALASPKRLEIVHLLRDQELSVRGMEEMLGLTQANLSQHLMVLREVGVVVTRRDGKQIYYKLADNRFVEASDLIREILIKKFKGQPVVDELTKKMSDLVPITHDPVCQMRVSPKTAAEVFEYKGERYYFCASGCKKEFIKNKDKYLRREN